MLARSLESAHDGEMPFPISYTRVGSLRLVDAPQPTLIAMAIAGYDKSNHLSSLAFPLSASFITQLKAPVRAQSSTDTVAGFDIESRSPSQRTLHATSYLSQVAYPNPKSTAQH